jgi:hypothetical protein
MNIARQVTTLYDDVREELERAIKSDDEEYSRILSDFADDTFSFICGLDRMRKGST